MVSVAVQIARLPDASMGELREMWREIFSGDSPHPNNRQFMAQRIAHQLQVNRYGSLDELNRKRLSEHAEDLPYKVRSRETPKEVLMRKHKLSLCPMGIALAGAALLLPLAGWARPITYPGGTNVMVGTDPTMDMFMADYTINKDWAVGWASIHYKDMDATAHGPQVTRGWRWNYPDSQANVYVWGGAGPTFVNDNAHASGWGGGSVDWEDRRWYTQAGTKFHTTANGPDFLWQTARVGVAPYVAEAGQLHSWLMLQVDHMPGSRNTWSATPMVRQFWGDYLWEAGVNTRGGVMLNLMKTF